LKRIRLFCKSEKIGLFLKEIKEKNNLKLELGLFAIKHKIWTRLQFLKMFGLKCKIDKIGKKGNLKCNVK